MTRVISWLCYSKQRLPTSSNASALRSTTRSSRTPPTPVPSTLVWCVADGLTAYFELRLLQQDQATVKSITDQLTASGTYAVFKDGGKEQDEVLKVQGIALGKVDDKHGKAIKFLRVDPSVFNIVIVEEP